MFSEKTSCGNAVHLRKLESFIVSSVSGMMTSVNAAFSLNAPFPSNVKLLGSAIFCNGGIAPKNDSPIVVLPLASVYGSEIVRNAVTLNTEFAIILSMLAGIET